MNGTTQDMLTETELLERQQRQAISSQSRRDSLAIIMQDQTAIELKIVAAGVYFDSFEFQLWENILRDDEFQRQVLLERGTQEFMVILHGLINGDYSDPDPTQKTGRMPSLLALGEMVSQLNDLQVAASQRPGSGFQAVSMLDLIQTALLDKNLVNQDPNADVPSYVRQVLYFESDAEFLMDLRYNILTATVLDKISGQSSMGLGDTLEFYLSALGWFGTQWVADFSKVNEVEISQSLTYLQQAIATRAFIRSIGGNPVLNDNIKRLMNTLNIKVDPGAGAAKAQATQDFKSGMSEFNAGI